jgi:cytochrome o ubiquinol oxidase subunit 1
VEDAEPYWGMKRKGHETIHLSKNEPTYEPIEMPRNSATGFVTSFFAVVMGFALIWHIWWLAIGGFVGAYATFVVFAWRDVTRSVIEAKEVARIDSANRDARRASVRGASI